MLTAFLDWFDRHKAGVIGSLALHTLLLFLLGILTIRTTPREDQVSDMRLDVVSDEEAMQMLDRIDQEMQGLPMAGSVQNLTSNITAQAGRPTWSEQRLSDRVEQDLRRMEQEEFERLAEERRERGEEIVVPELDPSKWDKRLYMDQAAEPVKVEGQVTVWHDLEGRNREHDMPGYLCRDAGRVAVRVAVGRTGEVLRAEVDAARSAQADDCMIEHALRSARRARFNPSATAPDPQRGTVYFLFMPQ